MRVFCLIMIAVFSLSHEVRASVAGEVKKGNDYYQAGAYDKAVEKYEKALERRSESDIINFNLGTAYYKQNEYPKAIEHLQKTLLSDDTRLRLNGQYNLGNAFYKFGIAQEKTNLDQAVSLLEQSLDAYASVLKVNPNDADAKYNFDIVQKELERLKKQKQQQGGQCPNPKAGKREENKNEPSKNAKNSEDKKSSAQEQPTGASSLQPGQQKQGAQEQKEGGEKQGSALPQNAENQKSASELKESPDQKNESAQGPAQEKVPSFEKASETGNATPGETLEKREAEMLLQDYRQREEPKGLLNFKKRSSSETPVTKDW